jgi:hypothetical protein
MYSVTWISDTGALETVTTPKLYRAAIIRQALGRFYRSVRIWQGSELIK